MACVCKSYFCFVSFSLSVTTLYYLAFLLHSALYGTTMIADKKSENASSRALSPVIEVIRRGSGYATGWNAYC